MSITVQDPSAADFFRRHGVMPAISPMRRIATWLALIALCLFAVAAQARDLPQDKRENKKEDRRDDKHEHKRKTPNILFVIMDDVGIDQMRVFGYGGETPPATPIPTTRWEAF